MLSGFSGSGEMTFLNMLASEAKKYGWLVITRAARAGMPKDIYQQLLIQAAEQIGKLGLSLQDEEKVRLRGRNGLVLILNQLTNHSTGLLI